MLIFKSKLYRDEIKHWILICVLFGWGATATWFSLQNREKLVLIGVDDSGTRLITEVNDRILQSEMKNFIELFIQKYYSYSEINFSEQLSQSSELMSESLWNDKKPKLLELKAKLEATPLSQEVEIQSIDKIDDSKIEVLATLLVRSKLIERKYNVKINISLSRVKRSESNPWGYQIEEVSDVTL